MADSIMAIKKCCIMNCNSCMTRKEDFGVTYHKFPKDSTLRDHWIKVTRQTHLDLPAYVCSRHFRKRDFKIYKDSKYVLKSDAVPSIFSWALTEHDKKRAEKTIMETKNVTTEKTKDEKETLNSSKESEGENLEAIKKFIEDQEKDILEQKSTTEPDKIDADLCSTSRESNKNEIEEPVAIPAVICEDDGNTIVYDNTVKDGNEGVKTYETVIKDDNKSVKTVKDNISIKNDMNSVRTITKMNKTVKSDNKSPKTVKDIVKTVKTDIKSLKTVKANRPNNKPVKDKKSIRTFKDDKTVKYDKKPVKTVKERNEIVINERKIDTDVDKNEDEINKESEDEKVSVAASVMDLILSETEAKMTKRNDPKSLSKQSTRETEYPGEKDSEQTGVTTNSMSLSVGSKVEAKDFMEEWFPAQIVEVDYDEMEVLVHYDHVSKKHDEWISVSSPRLRPIGSSSTRPSTPAPGAPTTAASTSFPIVEPEKEEPKTEDKPKLMFVVGERCLARWRDNRRFIATISEDLGNGKYVITFDDGVRWSCATCRLSKLKEPTKNDPLTVDTSSTPSAASTPSPDYGPGPGAPAATAPAPLPAYHTHLFDPTRDYLGTKSERREMKRKLNIKEIFNIGQKKKKIEITPKEKPQKVVKEKKARYKERMVVTKKLKLDPEVELKTEVKKEIPDAVASIIGTVTNDGTTDLVIKEEELIIEAVDIKEEMDNDDSKIDVNDMANSETLSAPESQDMRHEDDSVVEEEMKLEKFDKPDDGKHEEVIDRMKEVITKLEVGLNQPDKVETPTSEEFKSENSLEPVVVKIKANEEKPKKNLSKVKKGKKLRMLQEKKVKKQVERVKCELEEMKRQVEEMRQQMLMKTEELAKTKSGTEMPESFLLPGEWCAKWVNGQPVGKVSEMVCETKVDANSKPVLPRRSVHVEDKRLPPGWMKHMVRRSFGSSAGKWDVVLISPENKRFHTKVDIRNYLDNNPDESLKPYETVLQDFGIHLKLSRRMGWYTTTPDGAQENPVPMPAETFSNSSPLVKRKNLSLKKSMKNKDRKKKRLRLKLKVPREYQHQHSAAIDSDVPGTSGDAMDPPIAGHALPDHPPLEDGYVYVGSLKVQIIENLLRCPAEGCFKNFRNNTLLKMHITHYHRELTKMLGATPKVLDLAYARTRPSAMEMRKLKLEAERKTIKIKLPRLPKRLMEPRSTVKDVKSEMTVETPPTPVKEDVEKVPRSQDSPKLRNALASKPVRRPKVLLPVRRPEPTETDPDLIEEAVDVGDRSIEPMVDVSMIDQLDFETAISTHTVTKPPDLKRKGEKKRKSFASISKKTISEDEDWFAMNNSDVETRSSYPRSGTPDSKIMDQKLVSSESNEDQKDPNLYMYTETGERIKIVHMKREEIINCHCGFREEDGLMVQCELCLCWQHALCHNIQKESEVPDKYTCSICLSPRRGRRSQRHLHDQDRLYEGLLPGARPCEALRRSHELSGNLLRIDDALQALRVKYYVATKKDHPKLYLWAKEWETGEIAYTQEKLNSDYSDLSIVMGGVGKENLPLRPDTIREMPLDIRTPPSEDHDGERFSQRDNQLGAPSLLSGLLASPGGSSLDLPISTSELERLAKSVQEQESQSMAVAAPQPEAAIENSACRERLLRHIERCQTLIDARLDSIEAQVAELESQDPSFEDDETADFFPRTKQTVQMLVRDLDTMEELGVIT